jgi:hypothetical protein
VWRGFRSPAMKSCEWDSTIVQASRKSLVGGGRKASFGEQPNVRL